MFCAARGLNDSSQLRSILQMRFISVISITVRWTLVALLATFAAASHLRGDCTLTNLGITPINDLGPGLYKGYAGGLYPNGVNTLPDAHEAAGLNIATNFHRAFDRGW